MPIEQLSEAFLSQTNRRDFTQGLLKLVAGGIVLPPYLSFLLPEPSSIQTDHIQSRKFEIGQKYDILVVGMTEGFAAVNRPFIPDNHPSDMPTDWDLERLEILDQGFDQLPPHFRARDKSNQQLMVLLGKYSTVNVFSSLRDYLHLIELDFRRFSPANPRRAKLDLAHEAIHIITPGVEINVVGRNSDGSPQYRFVENCPWYPAVENILGRRFSDFAPPLWEEVQRRQNYIFVPGEGWVRNPDVKVELTPEQREIDEFAIHFGYSLRHSTPDEFIAVMGENYTQGRDYFIKRYADYLGESITSKLHDFARTEIYRGWTY